jgi:TolB-like protein/tetratricopeptide (TPR) repeat protein
VYPSTVRRQLEKILAHQLFRRSERMSRFLRFAVEHTLDGKAGDLKEYLIGVEVFDRRSSYDPRVDPIVRVEARRLRSKLKAYYDGDGRTDDVLIEFARGTYAPQIRPRPAPEKPQPESLPPATTGVNTIAVLPFVDLSAGGGHEYFSDGLTEELIHALTKVPGMRVVAWTSATRLRDRQQDLAAVREQLRAATALTGSVRIAGATLRVRAQLIDAETGVYLWSETFDRPMQDVFAIQEEMARAIVRTLRAQIAGAPEEPLVGRGRSTITSYDWYLKGRYFWHRRSPEGLQQALRHFEAAIAADETSAPAYAGLADAYMLLVDYGLMPVDEGMPKVKQAATRALELDPGLAEAYPSLAFTASHFERDWKRAGCLYRRAIELNPSYATTHHWLATDYYLMLGQFAEANASLDIALQLDPLSSIIQEGRGFIYLVMRRYDDAIAVYRRILESDPSFDRAYASLGRAMVQQEDYAGAIATLESLRARAGDIPSILGVLGQAYGLSGSRDQARNLLAKLDDMARSRFVPVTPRVMIHLGLGEKDRALDWLERGFEAKEAPLVPLAVHPAYDSLHGESRFHLLVAKLGL